MIAHDLYVAMICRVRVKVRARVMICVCKQCTPYERGKLRCRLTTCIFLCAVTMNADVYRYRSNLK